MYMYIHLPCDMNLQLWDHTFQQIYLARIEQSKNEYSTTAQRKTDTCKYQCNQSTVHVHVNTKLEFAC